MRLLKGVYGAVVALSALIVAGYLLWPMLVKEPEVAQPPAQQGTEETAGGAAAGPVVDHSTRKKGFYNILLVGVDDGNGNADTLMLLGYDTVNQKVGVVSVPRDTMVDRDWSSFPKINAAYGKGGVSLVDEELERTLGVPVDFYVMVDIQAFVEIVDEVGGLDYYVPENMYHDDDAGFVINLKEGQQHLDGYKALQLVRYRSYKNGQADIARTRTQQEVLTALAEKVLSWGSITRIGSFLEIFNKYVDTDLSMSDMLYFAQNALGLDTATGVATTTLEGRGDALVRYGKKDVWCYELDPEDTVETVNAYINPYEEPRTLEDMNLPRADRYYYNN